MIVSDIINTVSDDAKITYVVIGGNIYRLSDLQWKEYDYRNELALEVKNWKCIGESLIIEIWRE